MKFSKVKKNTTTEIVKRNNCDKKSSYFLNHIFKGRLMIQKIYITIERHVSKLLKHVY